METGDRDQQRGWVLEPPSTGPDGIGENKPCVVGTASTMVPSLVALLREVTEVGFRS